MRALWNRLLCLLGYHSYYKIKELSHDSTKVGCTCCSAAWGMHHPTKSFVEWDKDLEDIYAERNNWVEDQ